MGRQLFGLHKFPQMGLFDIGDAVFLAIILS